MKQLFTAILLFFIYVASSAQVIELQKLSKGKYMSSEVIYNESGTNVYGYLRCTKPIG